MNSGILLAFLLLSSGGAASSPEPTLMSVGVGNAVMLPVAIPKGQRLTNLLLRASSREEAVAIWMDSKEISVVSIHYADRVAFLEDEMVFRISNLSLGDGGTYEISTGFTASSPKLLSRFLVAVFNITQRISLKNDSCHIDLDCKAGMGPGHKVTYAWKDTKAGTTLSQEARLSQLVHPNQEKAYTCTAQAPMGQSTFGVVLQHPCTPSTASPGKRQHLSKKGPLPVAELSLLWLAKAVLLAPTTTSSTPARVQTHSTRVCPRCRGPALSPSFAEYPKSSSQPLAKSSADTHFGDNIELDGVIARFTLGCARVATWE